MFKAGRLLVVVLSFSFPSFQVYANAQPGAPAVLSVPTAAPITPYSVIYTGRLFGYFRYPEVQRVGVQSDSEEDCLPTGPTKDNAPEAFAFLDKLDQTVPIATLKELQEQLKRLSRPPAAIAKISQFLKSHEKVTAEEVSKFLASLKANYVADPEVTTLLERITLQTPLVGVGDNLAPFLLARRVWGVNPRQAKQKTEPSLLPKEDLEPSDLRSDNVACFLRLAHFAAVVPGKHDFYFGPQRLREIERFLNADAAACTRDGKRDDNCYSPVRMLGANISLKVQRTDSAGKNPAPTIDQHSKQGSDIQVALPKVVLPWLRSFTISAAAKSDGSKPVDLSSYTFYLANQSASSNWDSLALILDHSEQKNPEQKDPEQKSTQLKNKGVLRLRNDVKLVPSVEYHIMARRSGERDDEIGKFTVAEPYFTQGDHPWATARTASGAKVAIFGVVDQDLDLFVGRLNYTWLGEKYDYSPLASSSEKEREKEKKKSLDSSYETVVNITDPAEALNQALQMCATSEDCKNLSKVLLAQMPEAEVHQNLLPFIKLPPDTSPFDIVITQADPDAATNDRVSTLTNARNERSDAIKKRPVVLVPGSHFESPGDNSRNSSPYDLQLRFQIATVTREENGFTVTNEVRIADGEPIKSDPFNRFLPPLNALTVGGDNTAGHTVFIDKIRSSPLARDTRLETGIGTQDWQTGMEQISLRVMRDACHADVAMLQHRDIFYDPSLVGGHFTDEGIAAAIGAIFWKGDFIQCINITGQTLASVLQRSADLQRAEDAGEDTDLSRGWPVAFAGIMRPTAPSNRSNNDEKPQWLVHGEFLDPKRLYSVAITDYLANGDTGYPDLQHAQPDPQTPLGDLHLWRLASHFLAQLNGKKDYPEDGWKVLDAHNSSNHVPPPQTQDNFYNWLKSWSWSTLDAFSAPRGFDRDEQEKPTWFIRLYKADFTYSLFQHNVNESDVGAKFPGVTSVDLSNVDSQNWSADLQLRLQRDWRKWEFYGETDGTFGLRDQRSRSGPQFAYQPSQTTDVAYLELGGAYRMHPHHQNPSGLKLIFPTSVKSQIAPPYTQITPPNAKSSGGSLTPVSARRNFFLAARPGLRFEHNFPRTQNNSGQGGSGAGGSLDTSQSGSSQGSGSKGQSKNGGGQGSSSGGQGQSQSSTLNSYIEAGFEAGEVFRSPSEFVFCLQGVSNCAPPSALTQTVLVTNLLGSTGGLASLPATAQLVSVAADRNFKQQGAYVNFRIDAPLPGISSGEYIIENRGDIFFNHRSDAPVDVRLLNDMKHSLQLPLYGKFSIGPSIELIFFKTKVTGNYYFSYSTSISLNYSFDWHPGLNWPRTLGFGSSQTAPNPLPTK